MSGLGLTFVEDHGSTTQDLILDLSLASQFPVGVEGQDLFAGTASMQALAYRTEKMSKSELRELEYTMGPLLGLLTSDMYHPIAAKAAFGIRTLIPSRTCLNRFVECNGFNLIAKVLDTMLTSTVDLHVASNTYTIVENLAVVYRESARFFDNQIVRVGAIRHCVRMLKLGDATIRGISASVLSILSNNLEIVQQMFSYGAIKPILLLCDHSTTSEPELLAGMGCVVQLTRIPEIGAKVVKQGAIPLLSESLHLRESKTKGVASSVRNKALLALAWLSRIDIVKQRLATEAIFDGMQREFFADVPQNQTLVLQMMINLRSVKSDAKLRFNEAVRDKVLALIAPGGPWFSRNLTTKTLVLIYTDLPSKLYCAQHGALESIFNLIQSKSLDLMEVPMVALLSFCVHPEVPWLFLEKGGHHVLVKVLYAVNEVIREMAVVLLKALCLYDQEKIVAVIPADREHLMKADPESDPVVYGSEYGGLVQTYLQKIIENRRDMKYLLEGFEQNVIVEQSITEEELESYQATFMILDYDCNGTLALDEIKVLMVIMGEKMDEEEITLLFEEYDDDNSGELSFQEFCIMMKNWRARFGSGAAKVYNEAMQRGAIGKGRRAFERWYNKDEIEKQQIAKIKADKAKAMADKQADMEKHMGAEKLRVQREFEKKMREQKQRDEGTLPDI